MFRLGCGGRWARSRLLSIRIVCEHRADRRQRAGTAEGCMHGSNSRSMARSSAGAEWVRAPALTRSTPVSANAATVASVTPPDASSCTSGATAIAAANSLGQVLRSEVVDQDDVGSAPEGAVELFERIDLDLDDRSAAACWPAPMQLPRRSCQRAPAAPRARAARRDGCP